jgi:hypothetical protein
MFHAGYSPNGCYDEMFAAGGKPRPAGEKFVERVESLPTASLQRRQEAAEATLRNMGITFNVYGHEAGTEKVWPFDLLPRIIDSQEWATIDRGLRQRVRALNLFIEGYLPPPDPRLRKLSVAPDPGVIDVNVQPAHNWAELVTITKGLYEDAHHTRLGTEKFDPDGSHSGTGGGNHIVMGAPTPSESPFLRRPDLLRSLISYWHNHPSLSYLFSGRFVGPTSQAPRVDEGRRDAVYELQIAFEQIPERGNCPPGSLIGSCAICWLT